MEHVWGILRLGGPIVKVTARDTKWCDEYGLVDGSVTAFEVILDRFGDAQESIALVNQLAFVSVRTSFWEEVWVHLGDHVVDSADPRLGADSQRPRLVKGVMHDIALCDEWIHEAV
jgi:hypothetical protein